jgi:hypothetical protein
VVDGLTRPFQSTVDGRRERDTEFAAALDAEAATGETENPWNPIAPLGDEGLQQGTPRVHEDHMVKRVPMETLVPYESTPGYYPPIL